MKVRMCVGLACVMAALSAPDIWAEGKEASAATAPAANKLVAATVTTATMRLIT